MAITLGSNIASLRGQRQLSRTSDELGTVFQRLSSGQRINKASDDAAGLAIADSLRADARLYAVAMRNINDGISSLSIAEQGIGAQSDILIRMAELAEQAANGTYSSKQRDVLQGEYSALLQESVRIAESTKFNDRHLLLARGSSSLDLVIQAGIDGQPSSQLQVNAIDTGQFSGKLNLFGDYNGTGGVDGGDYTLYATFFSGAKSIDAVHEFFRGALMSTMVTDSTGMQRHLYIGIGLHEMLGASTYFTALTEDSDGNLVYNDDDNRTNIEGNINLISFSLLSGGTATLEFDLRKLEIISLNTQSAGNKTALEFTGVETQYRARDALDSIRYRTDDLNELRGKLGAAQSRLHSAADVLQAARTNAYAAEARIRDADIADESSRLVRLNILQQAASSILAQANQQPALALQLLRGGA